MKAIVFYFVLIFCFAFNETVKFRCDYKYTEIGWFKYHEIPATWDNARLQCHLEGGILASPTTPQIKTIMLNSFCKPKIFTGIRAIYSEGHYYSIDGIPLAQIPHEWSKFEPDNKKNAEDCLALHSDGKFSDIKCDEPRPYICYRKNSNVDVNVCGTPDAGYQFESTTNKCYKFHSKARTFRRAHFVCAAEGGHLAIINSDKESKLIANIFAKHPSSEVVGSSYADIAIIGFKYWHDNYDWITVHGQTIQEAGFAKFSPRQPDNANNREYCGTVFRNGLLNDGDCDTKYAFFCEKSPDYPAVCDSDHSQNSASHIRICDNDV